MGHTEEESKEGPRLHCLSRRSENLKPATTRLSSDRENTILSGAFLNISKGMFRQVVTHLPISAYRTFRCLVIVCNLLFTMAEHY